MKVVGIENVYLVERYWNIDKMKNNIFDFRVLPQYPDARYDPMEHATFPRHRTHVGSTAVCNHTMIVRPKDLWSLFDFLN